MNYSNPITQYKKSIIFDIKKTYIKNNISGTLKMYSEQKQAYTMELVVKTANRFLKPFNASTKTIRSEYVSNLNNKQ